MFLSSKKLLGSSRNNTITKNRSWDYGTYLGEIPEATETFNVVGNVNEWGIIITESTFGGLIDLSGSKVSVFIFFSMFFWYILSNTSCLLYFS